MIRNDEVYIEALLEIEEPTFNAVTWLRKYFELYKTTLNWPNTLPPIPRSTFTIQTKWKDFNKTYSDMLDGFPHI